MLFSNSLSQYTGKLSPAIKSCLEEIKCFFGVESIQVFSYDDNYIGVPATYSLSIPPLGPIGGVDLRGDEPILILISLRKYPNSMPFILSDRKDFPKKDLAHLYASKKSKPGKLCLVRNSPNEWFAGKTMTDLLAVGEQWFFKAVTGQLTDDGDEFDPIRLEGYAGYHIYRYEVLNEIVTNNSRFHKDFEMALLFSYIKRYEYESDVEATINSLAPVPAISIRKALDAIKDAKKNPEAYPLATPAFSLLIWKEDSVETEYDTDLPKSYGRLKRYFSHRGIRLERIIDFYVQNGLHLREEIPVIYAIRRPKKLVGYNGVYEFVNFVINAKEFRENYYPDFTRVTNQSHIEPFNKTLAEKLTGEKYNERVLFIGAGSLGSKILVHSARRGNLEIGAVDDDSFLQHNLARHALYQNRVGMNKAKAIVTEVSALYEFDTARKYQAFESSITDLPEDNFQEYNWLVDTSASLQVQNWLSNIVIPKAPNIARCELADDGRLGLMYIEGKDRNPRADDLINLTYYYARSNESILGWRIRDAEREVKNIDIGLGCSSTTTVMADDIISLHAAAFSRVLYSERQRANINDEGLIFLSNIETAGIPSLGSKYYTVKPFELYKCQGSSGWEIRLSNGLSSKFISLCRENGNVETGGVLVGVANYKTKSIHVLDIVEEPQDSKGTCSGFQRGIKGLPDLINTIKHETGGVIGYIGEWHTHPMDLDRLSTRDENTIEELIEINRRTPIPTCAIIVTNGKVLPFVFE